MKLSPTEDFREHASRPLVSLGCLVIVLLAGPAVLSADQIAPAIARALSSADPVVRLEAVGHLRSLDVETEGLKAALATASLDPDRRVAKEALGVLVYFGSAIAPWLAEYASSKDWRLRRVVARAIRDGGRAMRVSAPTLRSLLLDPSPTVRVEAAKALDFVAQDEEAQLAVVLEALHGTDVYARRLAAKYIGDLSVGEARVVPDLIRFLDDADAVVRAGVCDAFGSIGRDAAGEAVPHLGRMLLDPSEEVRAMAARSLWCLDKTAVPVMGPLIECAAGPDSRAAAFCQKAIADVGADGLPALLLHAEHSDRGIRLYVAGVLGSHNRSSANVLPTLKRLAHDRDELVALEAALSIGAISSQATAALRTLSELEPEGDLLATAVALSRLTLGQEDATVVEVIARALAGPDPRIRLLAAKGLGGVWIKSKKLLSGLHDALRSDAWPLVRSAAAWSISTNRRQGHDSVPALMGALSDPVYLVRLEAIRALRPQDMGRAVLVKRVLEFIDGTSGPLQREALALVRAIPHPTAQQGERLMRVLQDGDAQSRAASAEILGFWGLRSALHALQAARDDGEPRVRKAVRAALDRIEGGSSGK